MGRLKYKIHLFYVVFLFFCIFSTQLPLPSYSSAFSPAIPTTSIIDAPASSHPSSANTFSIIDPVPTSNLSEDAGLAVKIYSQTNKFLYAHSTLAFAPLKNLYPNDKIYLEQSGTGNYYRIDQRIVFSKTDLNSNSARRAAIYSAQYAGHSYDYALMTCGDGTNDDEDYRLVLFVSKI